MGLICGRLVWLQVIHHKDFVDRAARQQQRTFEVAPRRGILYDRNLHELAMTVLADSVYAVPSEIAERGDPAGDAKRQAVANALAKVVHTDPTDRFTSAHQIAARLNASRNFAWIARKLEPAEIARVKALNLKGVYFQQEFKRFYPNTQLAAQVLGYVGTDDNGLGGIERKYNQDLHGVPGRMLTAIDARRHVLDSQEREPDPGENLVLPLTRTFSSWRSVRSIPRSNVPMPRMAPSSSRIPIPAKFSHWRFAQPSIPTIFATHHQPA